MAGLHPGELTQMSSYLPHLPGESAHGRQQAVIFQITEHPVPVLQGADVADRLIEQLSYQLALVPVAGNRADYLVEIEVRDEEAISLYPVGGRTVVARGQQAGEPGHELRGVQGSAMASSCPRRNGAQQEPSAS